MFYTRVILLFYISLKQKMSQQVSPKQYIVVVRHQYQSQNIFLWLEMFFPEIVGVSFADENPMNPSYSSFVLDGKLISLPKERYPCFICENGVLIQSPKLLEWFSGQLDTGKYDSILTRDRVEMGKKQLYAWQQELKSPSPNIKDNGIDKQAFGYFCPEGIANLQRHQQISNQPRQGIPNNNNNDQLIKEPTSLYQRKPLGLGNNNSSPRSLSSDAPTMDRAYSAASLNKPLPVQSQLKQGDAIQDKLGWIQRMRQISETGKKKKDVDIDADESQWMEKSIGSDSVEKQQQQVSSDDETIIIPKSKGLSKTKQVKQQQPAIKVDMEDVNARRRNRGSKKDLNPSDLEAQLSQLQASMKQKDVIA
jgi:hypothetical protein